MHFHIITLFPELCEPYTSGSILGRAQKTDKGVGAKVRGKKIEVSYYNPRDFSKDAHKRVDDRPYGGGPGMVMQVEPIVRAWEKAVGRKKDQGKVLTLIMSPRGETFTQTFAKNYAKKYEHLVLICGRYEGIDARVKEILKAKDISVGDYVLTGGELPALTIIDAVARHIPGVLGEYDSLEDDRATNGETYTRPPVYTYKKQDFSVPDVLMGGDHKQIDAWRSKKG
ncbi:MAG: tRNA (guanosine(37)-N1)-methyltransferase TrmD [Candidatus Paceibacterota bacterium]